MEVAAIIVSILSFALSALTYYLLYLHKGKILMTQPTLIAIYNDLNSDGRKVFLRTLLISTARRGQVLENMFARVTNTSCAQNFTFWGHKNEKMSHGSGLYIADNGCVYDHHFSLWPKNTDYHFIQGNYEIEIFASILSCKRKYRLKKIKLNLSLSQCELIEKGGKIYFYWNNDQNQYIPDLI